MSTPANSAKKQNVFNEAKEILYDPYAGTLQGFENFSNVPWPEWSDAELNAEVWEEGKGKPSKNTAKSEIASPSSTFFEDPDPPKLPLDLWDRVFSWKRPHEVFPDASFAVYDPANAQFELSIATSCRRCRYSAMFNELLSILQTYALKHGFRVESGTPAFLPVTQGEPWRPWHHVYALCKAGKGQIHKPQFCPFGKYVLRLFYLGCWRRFVVDDKIPCDKDGNCMLPVTQVPGELWPILLWKGLLKIISVTPAVGLSPLDFHLLSAFTGWVSVVAVNKTAEQIWRMMSVLTPDFELPGDDSESKTIVKELPSKKGSSKHESTKGPDERNEQPTEQFCFVLATLEGFPEETNLTSTYPVVVTMNQNGSLVKGSKREATKSWKRIRWVYWALKKGIWTDELLEPPYRRLLVISFKGELSRMIAPDPKDEAALLDLPAIDESASVDNFSQADVKSNIEPEQWSDFWKFLEHLSKLQVFFKPSFFASSFRVTSLGSGPGLKAGATPAGEKTATKAEPQNVYFLSPNLLPTQNEPLLLFCESAIAVFLCFVLSVCPSEPKNHVLGYLDSDQPEVLKIGHSSLVLERFDWRKYEQGELVGAVKAVGNSSIFVNMSPGRHLLKLWLSSDSPYVLNVISNVELTLHKGPKIRFLMTNESVRILNYIDKVSNSFVALIQAFGKKELPSALADFYKAIRPGNDKVSGYRRKIDEFIETFLTCILLTLQSLIANVDELRIMMVALQSLFVNPKIWCDLPKGGLPSTIFGGAVKKTGKNPTPIVKERTLSQILAYDWSPEELKKVIMVQRIFRGFRMRLLLKYQTPARKEFKPLADRLKKIAETLFTPSKREAEVGKLIRKVAMVGPHLIPTFRFHEDLPNVVQVDEYAGKVANVEPFAWVPITRFVVACHCDDPVPCAFYVSCNLQQFVVLGVNNDTDEEIFRLTRSVSPHYYQSNTKGYTILVFGWNEANAKTVNWRLEMVRMKYFHVVHLCNAILDLNCRPYSIPTLEVVEIKNLYIPNRRSRLCRCLIRVQRRTLLTFRLSTSYPEVQFVATISLDKRFCTMDAENANILDEIVTQGQSACGVVLLCSVILEPVEPNPWWGESNADEDSTLYILEAFIINKSWPLTKHEWGVVEPIRTNGEQWKDSTISLNSRKGLSESKKKLTRMTKRASLEQKSVESPFWLLQVLIDSSEGADSSDQVSLEEDRSYAESVKAMKISWEEKNPGRRKKGRELRFDFLYRMYLEEKKREEYEGEGGFEEAEQENEKGELGSEAFRARLERMASFSYLTNDTSLARFDKSPRILPKMPTYDLLLKYRRSRPLVAFREEGSDLEDQSDSSVKLTENEAEEIDENRRNFLSRCVHFRFVMANYFLEEQKLSSRLMEEAYEDRLKAIERMAR